MERKVFVTAGIGTVLAAAAVAAGWYWWQNDSPTSMKRVSTVMPSGPTVFVKPECTLTQFNTLKNPDGSTPDHEGGPGGPVPAGFTPVRAVRCGAYGDDKSETETQLELRDPAVLSALLAAYRTTSTLEQRGSNTGCPAIGESEPPVALIAADGTAIWPAPPQDGVCNLIIPAVRTAITDKKWIVTASATIPFS